MGTVSPARAATPVPVHEPQVEVHQLANGLRLVVSPEPSSPVVAVGVFYRVGFRLEPQGQTGFAHLFEHLMFQGSAHAAKMVHWDLVQNAGGVLNGFTRHDYTAYFEVVPSSALETMCYLEADRMAALDITEETLQNQREVVKEEVRVNVLNQPYGGFSWLELPQHAFSRYPNAHNFYGEFSDLERATVADARRFYDAHYAPGNATMVLTGGIDPDAALAVVERHFGGIPARPVPPEPDLSEPLPTARRRVLHRDPQAPVPRIAVGYRMAPFGDRAHLPLTLAADILTDGRASRLHRRMVRGDQVLLDVAAGPNFPIGDALDFRGPALWTLEATRRPEASAERVLQILDAEMDRLGADGPTAEELVRAQRRWLSAHYAWIDSLRGRMTVLGTLDAVHRDPRQLNRLPAAVAAVTPEDVAQAAREWLRPERSTVLDWVPGTR